MVLGLTVGPEDGFVEGYALGLDVRFEDRTSDGDSVGVEAGFVGDNVGVANGQSVSFGGVKSN